MNTKRQSGFALLLVLLWMQLFSWLMLGMLEESLQYQHLLKERSLLLS